MKVKTYQYLHKPFRLLWLESDEIFLLFIGLLLGIYIYTIIFLIICIFVFFIRKLKNQFPRGFIKHISYFLGLFKFKHYPTFFETEFQE